MKSENVKNKGQLWTRKRQIEIQETELIVMEQELEE